MSSVEAAVQMGAKALLIGVCPVEATTLYPSRIREAAEAAISAGMQVINPLHVMPWNDPYFLKRVDDWPHFLNLRAVAKTMGLRGYSERKTSFSSPDGGKRLLSGEDDYRDPADR